MPLSAHRRHRATPTVEIVFDKPAYAADEPVTGRVVVTDGLPTEDVYVTASVTADGVPVTATAVTAVVVAPVTYDRVTAPGYRVTQDPDDPSRFVATPARKDPNPCA